MWKKTMTDGILFISELLIRTSCLQCAIHTFLNSELHIVHLI